ncbi:hypothetical protein [Streptomyces fuscigenes]|uniref:hypothetical protein n=1 Tax=Streptomyces fuscigenes TaxID=1528880 RepID=UPI001F2CC078|nr:hypothetical protein [Streptomyces fuscigenes]MCF3960613.1 hypothetical protein [Streptomyces fuscigenes]
MAAPLISNAATVRLTRVDGCGRPVCGDDASYVTDCFASVEMEANTDDGTDVTFTAANGRQCGFKKGCPTLNGYDLTFTFFQASPEMIEIMTGSPVYFGYDNKPIGFDSCSIPCNTGFALEVWTDVLGDDVCDDPNAQGAWVYFLLPWVTGGLLGDLELANEAVNLELTGSTKAGGKWGVGPYDVQAVDAAGTPGQMLTPLGSTCHRRTFITSIAPPEPDTTYIPVAGEFCMAS